MLDSAISGLVGSILGPIIGRMKPSLAHFVVIFVMSIFLLNAGLFIMWAIDVGLRAALVRWRDLFRDPMVSVAQVGLALLADLAFGLIWLLNRKEQRDSE